MSQLMKVRRNKFLRLTSFRLAGLATVVLAGHFLASDFALAHHSNAMFDKAVLRQEQVTVREFQWTNPHIWIQVYLQNEAGEQEEWSIEGGGPNTLFRRGWRPNSFEPGEVVELRFFPMRDGSNAALFVGARFSDGETLGKWDE